MLIPLILAVVAFCIVQGVCMRIAIRSDLTVPIMAAVAVFIVSYCRQMLINFNRDKPEICSYKMQAPQAYALIKKVLETFRFGERKWQVADPDPIALSIRAISGWREYHPSMLPGLGRGSEFPQQVYCTYMYHLLRRQV